MCHNSICPFPLILAIFIDVFFYSWLHFVLMHASPLFYKLAYPTLPLPVESYETTRKRNIRTEKKAKKKKKIKLIRSKRFCRGSFKHGGDGGSGNKNGSNNVKESPGGCGGNNSGEIKWELRPGGMLVQKRESGIEGEATITIRVSIFSKWHDISIEATSTFGKLKMMLSMVSGLESREQRLLFKGKEREDNEFLHMVGVRDRDKVLLLEDPAIKEIHGLRGGQPFGTAYRTISV